MPSLNPAFKFLLFIAWPPKISIFSLLLNWICKSIISTAPVQTEKTFLLQQSLFSFPLCDHLSHLRTSFTPKNAPEFPAVLYVSQFQRQKGTFHVQLRVAHKKAESKFKTEQIFYSSNLVAC